MPRPNRCAYRGWSAVLAIAAIVFLADAIRPMVSPTFAPALPMPQLDPRGSTHAARAPRGRVRRPASRPAQAGAPVHATLASGTRVVAVRIPGAHRVAVRIAWPGGFAADPAPARATTLLLAETLPATCIPDPDLAVDGDVRGVAGRWSLGLRSSWSLADWDAGLAALAACVGTSRVLAPPGARDRLRELAAGVGASARRAAYRAYLGARWGLHPLGREPLVDPADLDAIDGAALARARADRYPPGTAVIAIVGDVDPSAAIARVRDVLDRVPSGPANAPAPAGSPPRTVRRELYLDGGTGAAAVVVGLPGLAAADPDRVALDVLAEILADPRGRLARAVGPGASLAVAVADAPDTGFLALTVDVRPPVADAVTAARAVLAEMIQDGPTAAELARARAALTPAATPEALADELVRTALTGIDRRAALAAVEPAQLHRLAGRVLRWDDAVVVTVRPPDTTPGVRRQQGKRTPGRRRLVRPTRTPRPTS